MFIAPSAYLLGGVQDWLYMLVCGLRRIGHEVTVGVPDNTYHRIDRFNRYFEGMNAKSFTNRTGTAEGRINALTSFFKDHPADIIVGVNIGDIYKAFSRIKRLLDGTKLVMTIHAIEQNYYDDLCQYSDLIDAVITTNKVTQKMAENMRVLSTNRIFYAPYGIGLKDVKKNCNVSGALELAWVGRIETGQKRVSDVCKILEHLDKYGLEYRLSIAGDGPYREQIEKDLKLWTKKGVVRFHGFLSKDEMAEFYSAHNILLITSNWETGPIVAWEAMAAGLVVVSSQYVGSRSEGALIDNVTALSFPVGDCKTAAAQIARLRDPGLREKVSASGREMVMKRYSEEESLKAWVYALNRVMKLDAKSGDWEKSMEKTRPSGRLQRLVGIPLSEKLRVLFSTKIDAGSPGNEWPHSLQGKTDQQGILSYAEHTEALP